MLVYQRVIPEDSIVDIVEVIHNRRLLLDFVTLRGLNHMSKWVCLKIEYIPNYSHLIGIMISKTIGFRGTNLFSDTPKYQKLAVPGPCHNPLGASIHCMTSLAEVLLSWSDPRASRETQCFRFRDRAQKSHIWVCLKTLCTPKPNGFADHYPYEKWLFHWEYTQHFQTNPFAYICSFSASNLGVKYPYITTIQSYEKVRPMKIYENMIRSCQKCYSASKMVYIQYC